MKHNQKVKKRVTELATSAAAAAALAKEQGKKKKKSLLQQQQQQQQQFSSSSASGGSSSSSPESYSDQGYCRPRVLILCPLRGTALRFIEGMMHILGDNTRLLYDVLTIVCWVLFGVLMISYF